jgi:hypothetical protein
MVPAVAGNFGASLSDIWTFSPATPQAGDPVIIDTDTERHEFLGSKRDDRFSNPFF